MNTVCTCSYHDKSNHLCKKHGVCKLCETKKELQKSNYCLCALKCSKEHCKTHEKLKNNFHLENKTFLKVNSEIKTMLKLHLQIRTFLKVFSIFTLIRI